MSLLTTISAAAVLLNIPAPSTVVGNPDPQVAQLYGLLLEECDELLSKNDWPVLITAGAFTVAVAALPFAQTLPADFKRFTVGSDIWNTGRREKLIGPLAPDQWQRLLAFNVGAYPQYWRLYGGTLNIWGAGAGDAFSYEYVSTKYAISTGGTRLPTFANDTDGIVLPERLVKLALLWRWKRAKGLDYAEEMSTYEREFERETAHTRGLRIVSTASGCDMPDNYWPGVITP